VSPGGLPAAATEWQFGRFLLSQALWGAAFHLGRRSDSAAFSWGFALHPAQGDRLQMGRFWCPLPKICSSKHLQVVCGYGRSPDTTSHRLSEVSGDEVRILNIWLLWECLDLRGFFVSGQQEAKWGVEILHLSRKRAALGNIRLE